MASDVTIKPVESRRELMAFIKFPWNVYRGETTYENWVPPLLIDEKGLFNPKKHPFHRHSKMQNYLAYKDNRIAGRVSAIVDYQFIKSRNENTGYFGFFESIDDKAVSEALFEAAADWLRNEGMEKVIGPISPTPNHILGLLINNFDKPPVIQTPYNPPYYVQLYEAWGLTKEEDHYAYFMLREQLELSEKIRRVNELARKRGGITFRPIHMRKFYEEVEIIRTMWNEAWKDNRDHVPWTKEEFHHMAADLRLAAIPELVLLAFVGDEPAGFSIPLPNINETLINMNGRLFPFGIFRLLIGKNRSKLLRLAILGIRPKFQNKGIDSIFIYETYERGSRLGFIGAEFSLVLEDNHKLRNLLETWGCERYKTYRVYRKKI